MKIIEKVEKGILIDNIKDHHIVVAVINRNPCILTRAGFNSGPYFFVCIDDKCIEGNSYRYGKQESIKSAINNAFGPNTEIEVFEGNDWRRALIWLSENA